MAFKFTEEQLNTLDKSFIVNLFLQLQDQNDKLSGEVQELNKKMEVLIEQITLANKNRFELPFHMISTDTFAPDEERKRQLEADEYIRQNGEVVKIKEVEKASLETEILELYQKIISSAKIVMEKEKKVLETEIKELKELKDEIQPYFAEVNKLQKIRKAINIEDLTVEKIKELSASVDSVLLKESQDQALRETYQQILAVLGYGYENETIQQTYAKVKNLITETYQISNFSYEMLVSKLNAIDSVLTNQDLANLKQKLDSANKKNQNLNVEIKDLDKLKKIAEKRAEDIEKVIDSLSKEEYEKIGPSLGKFYNKLARVNSSGGINIVQKNNGISLVDDKEKNIVNILSNGQISVFMLSYFFAGINARNDSEKMKVYFIDDLTACMDDVNMLAFMDLLKYVGSRK